MNQQEDRLRRQLRALTAVNRQLQAQLEGSGGRAIASTSGARREPTDVLSAVPTARIKVRRSSIGDEWLEQLTTLPSDETPTLRRRDDGATFLTEGDHKRRIRSGLLVAALERHLGPRVDAEPGELDRRDEAAPVEVLEGPSGPPFVVVGGQRLPLRGLPLSYPVSAESSTVIDDGPELDVAPVAPARAPSRQKRSVRHAAGRLKRASARHGGVLPALAHVAGRPFRRRR